ncbi:MULTISPECIES: MbtH family protein [Streptomyces]|uniref:MbtH protein n=1 Tax=Streptomyces virginiae TaxID=1961 RepID=A0ABQ3NR94_STRVG|nr:MULTISPECIES: MbtH family protein [Streptomyces]MBP2348077.1 MbtH protein [Streptomyces virginiae]MCI4084812.1 MbtH family protein [Streptomyces sp. MMS21 TC-5]QNE29252.1 MbtH family protein [Streptomyces sp. INR7]RST11762.1 MbtH family protein [Streptomyces sp. WAC05950]GGQ06045.1 MbtH protein [Streptomyces virginiae]
MTNPFEDDEATYFVLVNQENQHSLWPASIEAPAGWTATHGPAGRQDCLEHIEKTWTDMRPAGLVAALGEL